MAFLSPHGVFSSLALFLRPFVKGSPLASYEFHGLKPEGPGPLDRARIVTSQGVHSAPPEPPGDPETSRGSTRQGGQGGARLCGRRGCTRPAGGVRRWRPRPPGPPGAPRLPPGGANSTPGRGPGAGRRQRRGPGREADRRAAASQRRSSRCSQCRRGAAGCRGTAEHPRAAGSGRRRQVARGSAWCGPSSSSPAPGGRGPAAGPPPSSLPVPSLSPAAPKGRAEMPAT